MEARRICVLLAWGVVLVAAGCARTVSLHYTPPGTTFAAPEPGLVSVRPFRDARRNGAHELGRVRGIFGTAIKLVRTEEPVAAEVTRVFSDALAERGLLARGSSGAITLEGEVRKFDCNYYREHEAHAVLALRLIDSRGRVLLERLYESHHVGGGVFTAGVFASRRYLAGLAERTLIGAIDAALSDPAFVLAASSQTGGSRAGSSATTGRTTPADPAPEAESDTELKALERLYERGLVSQEEYERHRAALLGAL